MKITVLSVEICIRHEFEVRGEISKIGGDDFVAVSHPEDFF